MTFSERQMAGRKQKLADLERTATPKRRPNTQTAPTPKKEGLTVAAILSAVYSDVPKNIRDEIASLSILDPRSNNFESLLEDIVESYNIDPDTTREILGRTTDNNEIALVLPSVRRLELLHTTATQEEFQAVRGAIMSFSCRYCKGREFYFDPDRHTGAADEISKSQMFCAKCLPRYT